MFTVTYVFAFESGRREEFALAFDEATMASESRDEASLPDWTRLDFYPCPHCPLDVNGGGRCPPAASLSLMMERLGRLPSFERVTLEVITADRVVSQKTSLSSAMRSLIGLIMGASNCPHMALFRPMARFHLPLSSEMETVFRVVSSHLLGQYFKARAGQPADYSMDGLVASYQAVLAVNMAFAQRIRQSGVMDETNALAQLYSQSEIVPFALTEFLSELEPLFSPPG